ncbi:MAG: hypothetical protein IBJ15_00200 [Alphaproteobacteria bacterium]|nr:hypothetical protein [Alphaproteobacteria bacterium]
MAGQAVVWSEMIEEDPRFARQAWGSWSCYIDLPGFGEAGVILVVVDRPGSSQVRLVVGFPGGSRFYPCEFDIGAPAALTEGLARGDWPRAFAAAAALPSARRAN